MIVSGTTGGIQLVIEILISALAYLWQIFCLMVCPVLLASMVYLLAPEGKMKPEIKKKVALITLLVLLLVEIAGIVHITNHPTWHCPEEFEEYISEEEKEEILSVGRGLYSYRLPLFPVSVSVVSADENEIIARVLYFFFYSADWSFVPDDVPGRAD